MVVRRSLGVGFNAFSVWRGGQYFFLFFFIPLIDFEQIRAVFLGLHQFFGMLNFK